MVRATRAALRRPARIGSGPSRFCAVVAAERARARRAGIVRGAADLAPAPVSLLRRCEETAHLPEALERFGIDTLGALAALPRSAVADRFGRPGLRAHDLARGEDTPLVPRSAGERLEEGLELEESASGAQLGRALELLVDRLLARRERRGRTVRVAVLSATLVEGGTWRERVVFREPLADPTRMVLALGRRLETLPAPADALRLSAERLGPPHAGGRALFDDGVAQRSARLREAIRQARAVAGPDAALRVLAVDPGLARARAPRRPDAVRAVTGARRLGVPQAVSVLAGRGGRPEAVDRHEVVAVRESWLVEDRWWTERPLRRRYWEVVTVDGRDLVVFRDLEEGRWYRHR